MFSSKPMNIFIWLLTLINRFKELLICFKLMNIKQLWNHLKTSRLSEKFRKSKTSIIFILQQTMNRLKKIFKKRSMIQHFMVIMYQKKVLSFVLDLGKNILNINFNIYVRYLKNLMLFGWVLLSSSQFCLISKNKLKIIKYLMSSIKTKSCSQFQLMKIPSKRICLFSEIILLRKNLKH